MEDIAKRERLIKFVLEGEVKNGWQTVFEGSSIGRKFIYLFDVMEVSSVRVKIIESKGSPQIKSFNVYNIE